MTAVLQTSAANQLLRAIHTRGIADLLVRSQLRPKDDDAYYPSQPIPESEDMDIYCEQEEASMLPSDAGEEAVIPESQDAYKRMDTCFSSGKQACKRLQHCLT